MRPIIWSNPVNRNHPLNRGLVAWWLNTPNVRGGLTFRDIAGGHHGTLTNMDPAVAWVPSGRKGSWGALDFAGGSQDDYVNVAGSAGLLNGLSSFTISLWFRIDSTINSWPMLVGHRDDSDNQNALGLSSNTGSLDFRVNNTGVNTTATFAATNGTWYHATAVYDGVTQKIYVDGAQKASGAKTGTLSQADVIKMGWDDFQGSRLYDGQLDDICIYDRALNAAEVRQRFNLSSTGYGGLLNRQRRVFSVPAVGGGISIPIVYHHRQRNFA